MLDRYGFEVFGGESSFPRLRWFPVGGAMVDRELDRSAIDVFAAGVGARYKMLAPDLAVLGQDLFRWLDGPTERWLASALARERPMVVYIDCEEKLRGLPWELIHDNGFLAVHPSRPLLPVRRASVRESDPIVPGNRPLRVLFMASSPQDIEPVLDFEHEESVILQAAAGLVEVVVEESGTLAGLKVLLERFGAGYFDVLHITGHARATSAGARFLLEDEFGGPAEATATDLAVAVGQYWPALVFLSGCQTAAVVDSGEVASMAEALVTAGAPAVLGWALPVGDHAATLLAGSLYRSLAVGAGRDQAVADARRALHRADNSYWHLLRLYTDRTPLGALVTAPGEAGRVKLRARPTSEQFLDPDGQVRVASHDGFVGRRRQLQACLRALRPAVAASGAQVLIMHGMGGLGKSTLAARLLDRLRVSHPHQAVWVGPVDEKQINRLTALITVDAVKHVEINKLLDDTAVPFEARLRFVFDGPLRDTACAFVLDDFEDGNLQRDENGNFQTVGDGRHVCNPAALLVLTAFATAIAATGNESRVIVTSRYDIVLPDSVAVHRESLVPLERADLDKKLQLTKNFGSASELGSDVREHAIAAAAGIPRLIERLDRLISDPGTDITQVLDAIDTKVVEYREELLAEKLLTMQQPETRRLLALAAIYQIPVPVEALAVLSPDGPIQGPLDRAVAVGLIDKGRHPSGRDRYLVSNLLKPLLESIEEHLTDDDRNVASQAGCRCLYNIWVNT